MHRIEGLKVKYLEALQLLVVLHSTDHCKVDGVLVFGSRRECSPENNFVGSNAVHGEGIAQRQFVLCERTGLVRAQHIHACEFFNRRQSGDNRFFLRQQARTDRHRHREHCGHGYRDRGNQEHKAEFQRSENLVAAEKRDDQNQHDQRYRQHDQVVTYLQDRLLEMAYGIRLLHHLRGFAEIGIRSGGIHHCVDFALTDDRSREHSGTWLGGYRQ